MNNLNGKCFIKSYKERLKIKKVFVFYTVKGKKYIGSTKDFYLRLYIENKKNLSVLEDVFNI
jgi:hypothetical protein